MTDILIFKYLHIMCLVYWLGGDLGTFIASRYLLNTQLSAESRLVATRILIACDQGPRLALPLILSTGLQLAFSLGILAVPISVVIFVWITALCWLYILVRLHVNHGKTLVRLSQTDWLIRLLVCVVSLSAGVSSVLWKAPLSAAWAGYKLLLFGVIVLLGIVIRIKLTPFFSVFSNLINNTVDTQTNQAIASSIGGARPYVFCIWGLLFLISALGLHIIS